MIAKRKWFPAGKAKSEEEINERKNVCKNSSYNNFLWFYCRRNRWHHCQFMVRWDEQSGQLWESGEHNHESSAYKYRKTREWQFVAKVSCFKQIRCQYTVQKSGGSSPTCIKFRCNFHKHKKQQKCHYIMRWNSETGELFESGQHSNHPAPRIKIFYKWHLLETMRQNSAAEAEIRQRYTVKKVHKKYGRFVFKCSRCDGQKCDFRLRCDYNSTEIHWNKEQQCQQRKNRLNRNDADDSKMDAEEDEMELEDASHNQQQQAENSQHETKLPSMPVVFLEEIHRADYKCRLAPMKREAMAVEPQQPAANNPSLLPLAIDEADEEEAPMSHWRPNSMRRVKKEEDQIMDTRQNIVNNGKGRNEDVEEAPTKMLLRERKRPPNYAGFDGNGKKKGRAKK